MQTLTNSQVEKIIKMVSKVGISLNHLEDELIDHICCEVERFMSLGLCFDKAYEEVMQKIATDDIRLVQEKTLLLIDKKYRNMKASVKIIGLVSMLILAIGALFKILHWPGASVLLVTGFFFIGTFFLPMILWVLKKEAKIKGRLIIYFVSVIGSVALIFGILAKIQHWPGAGFLIVVGFGVISLFLIPLIFISNFKDKEKTRLRLPYFIGGLSLVFFLMGSLFKIMHWPGAGVMLILGALSLNAVFFPFYVKRIYYKATSLKPDFLFLIIGMMFFNMFNILLAINVSKNTSHYFETPLQDIILTTEAVQLHNKQLYNYLLESNEVSEDTIKIAEIKKIEVLSNEICHFIDNTLVELISLTNGISIEEANRISDSLLEIENKQQFDITTFYFCGQDISCTTSKAQELKTLIDMYKKDISEYIKDEPSRTLIEDVLSTENIYSHRFNQNINWTQYHFHYKNLITVITTLKILKQRVLIAKNIALENKI